MNLRNKDYAVVFGGILLSLLGAFAAEAGVLSASLVGTFGTWLPRLTILVIFVGLAFVYLSRDLLGGEVVKNLEVVAAGFLIYAVTWGPHKLGYHAEALGGAAASIFGVFTPGAWNVFWHTLVAATFGVVSFGFYRFWEMSQEVNA